MSHATMTPRFSAEYAPTLAEDGKFVRLDHADIASEGYPESGAGKYAVLTYMVHPLPASVNTIVNMSSTFPAGLNKVSLSTKVQTIEVFNATTDSTAFVLLTSGELNLAKGTAAFTTISSIGVPIIGSATSPGFYTTNFETSGFYIETTDPADLRIFGHYKLPM